MIHQQGDFLQRRACASAEQSITEAPTCRHVNPLFSCNVYMIDWQFLDHRPWLRLHQSGSSNSWGTSLKWSSVYWRKWLHFLLSVAFMYSSVPFCSERLADSLGLFFFIILWGPEEDNVKHSCAHTVSSFTVTEGRFLSVSSAPILPVLTQSQQHGGDPRAQPHSLLPSKAAHNLRAHRAWKQSESSTAIRLCWEVQWARSANLLVWKRVWAACFSEHQLKLQWPSLQSNSSAVIVDRLVGIWLFHLFIYLVS